MKLLYVAPRFHPNQYPIIEGLIKKGHTVQFCVAHIGPTEKHDNVKVNLMEQGFLSKILEKIFMLKGENHAENRMQFFFIPRKNQIKKILKDFSPDAVVLRDRNFASLSFFRMCKKLKIDKVLLYNQSPIYTKPSTGFKGFLKKWFFAMFPKKRISVCRYEKFPFDKTGYVKDENAVFMPHVPRMNSLVNRTYSEDGMVRIFCCGKYRPYKNHMLVVEAAKKLADRGYENFYVTVVGQTDNDEEKKYYDDMKKRICEYGLDKHFNLLRSVPYDEIPNFYMNNDVFVLASGNEQATVSILDSLSYGLATISTSFNGTADYIRVGETGYVFETQNADDLSEKIEEYLKSPELAKIHGQNALKDIEEEYGFENYYKKYMKLMGEI